MNSVWFTTVIVVVVGFLRGVIVIVTAVDVLDYGGRTKYIDVSIDTLVKMKVGCVAVINS